MDRPAEAKSRKEGTMEIRRTALCGADATVTFEPREDLPRYAQIFNAFLSHVARRLPDVEEPFRGSVTRRFRDLARESDLGRTLHGFEPLLPKRDELQRHRTVYLLDLLGIRGAIADEMEVTRVAAAGARLYPMYHQGSALCDLIGRNEAIPFIERYMDEWMAERTKADESLEDLDRFWKRLEGPIHETAEVAARIHRGKIASRVNRCLWADVMRPLNDPDLSHALTCYGDFPQIRAINKHFVLTRTMTLMRGDPYCDGCTHDRRHVEAIEHPSREFFESLGAR